MKGHRVVGEEFCNTSVSPGLFNGAGQSLTPYEKVRLWEVFQAIGIAWEDLHPNKTDSSNLKSSWLDFINAKTESEPSYVAEYSNAVSCIDELEDKYGTEDAYHLLFFKNKIPSGPPLTKLAHFKKFVIDEFIRVNIVASGFKSFGGPDNHGKNYKGYLGGSRYNLRARVKSYEPIEIKGDES